MSKLLKRLHQNWFLVSLAAAILSMLFVLVIFSVTNRDSMAYHKLCNTIFQQELTGNTLTLHYLLSNPGDYGLPDVPAVLPLYSAASREQAGKIAADQLAALEAIDADHLSESDHYSYQLLHKNLLLDQQLAADPYLAEPLSPSSGMHTLLPVLLAEYRFDSVQDIEDYLCLLSQVDDYFSSILRFEEEKQQQGLFMISASADKVINSCNTVCTAQSLSDGNHFLITSFSERMKDFQLRFPHSLSEEMMEHYTAQNLTLLTDAVAPAYAKLSQGISDLKRKNMADFPEAAVSFHGLGTTTSGKSYYLSLLQRETGSYRSPSEIEDLLYEDFHATYQSLLTALQASSSGKASPSGSSQSGKDLSAVQILQHLEQDMASDFPAYPESASIHCDVKSLSASLSAYSAPAFFLTPQIDAYDKNVIYLNPTAPLTGITLFTTLAHEGYPGHLYQTVYTQMRFTKDRNPIRNILNYTGYSEGWAFYTELKSYEYAAAYYHLEDPARYTLSRRFQLCLSALLDFTIHYRGASQAQVLSLLTQFGIEKQSAAAIYEYIAEEPCCYVKYYLSYLEVLNLKAQAQKLWQDQYSAYRFHKFYLNAGPSDFESLTALLATS